MRFLSTALLVGALLLTACEKRKPADSEASLRFPPGASKAASIQWQPWNEATFARAEAAGKAVFVSVRNDVCYWCDVFDRISLSDDRVIAFLNERMVPVRVDIDERPEWFDHYGDSLPMIAVVRNRGDIQASAGFLQPSELVQRLRATLKDEPTVRRPATAPRFHPSFGLLDPAMVRKHLYQANFLFDFEADGYGYSAAKSISLDDLTTDLLLGTPYGVKDARSRAYLHIGSMLEHLYDAEDGGFLHETKSRLWADITPIKRAADQAHAAATLIAVTRLADEKQPLPMPREAYLDAAARTLAFLEENYLTPEGWVRAGEVATRDYYLSTGKKRRKQAQPRVSTVVRTDISATTALWLSRAGRWGERPEKVSLAARILERVLSERTDTGLFWHLPLEKKAPDRLVDAEAALAASLELYAATAEERWLNEAEKIAAALAPLRTRTGYASATSEAIDNLFTAEIVPQTNLRLANSLWQLGVLKNDDTIREDARRLVEAWAGAGEELKPILTPFVTALWTVSQPPIRVELPRKWKGKEAVAFQRYPEPRTMIRWTGQDTARVCTGSSCGEPLKQADEVAVEAARLWNVKG